MLSGGEPTETGGERGKAGGNAQGHAGARDGDASQGRHQEDRG